MGVRGRRLGRRGTVRMFGWRGGWVAGVLLLTSCSTALGQHDTRPATALRDRESAQIERLLNGLPFALEVSDGGTAGPFECSAPKWGLEYYDVRWIADLRSGGRPFAALVAALDATFTERGYGNDRTWLEDEVRPTVIYYGLGIEFSASYYKETDLVLLELTTRCGVKR